VNGPVTRLEAGPAAVEVDADDGARITSLRVDGQELLVTGQGGGFRYGCFVMAPWAGRLRDGRATALGRTVEVPVEADDGHGLHGLVHSHPWDRTGRSSWEVTLPPQPGWFAPVRLRQDLQLEPDRLRLTLTATTDRPTPLTVGWHPWFRRHLGDTEVELEVPAAWIHPRDQTGIPTTARAPVPPLPWDDSFGGLSGPVVLRWGRAQRVTIETDAPIVVVYTGRPYGVCVEPQSGPPDEANRPDARIVTPAAPLVLHSTWRWELP
jgi:aldose 1-epimerase